MAADLSRITKKYSNGEVTIVWKPARCIHSQKCFNGLPTVFDPAKRPWIDANGSDTEHIISQVSKCPSAALSFYLNSEGERIPEDKVEIDTVVEAKPNGPLFVYGNIWIKKADGSTEKRTDVTAFCRCGNSRNKPFCDGSHLKAEFKG
ncbi:MAG TPA: (4Fe-4S)-binding protein [Ignavibacteria bacterium]|nr:(4Fe-4S)-binding protein [Ignavibacteria bacterium]